MKMRGMDGWMRWRDGDYGKRLMQAPCGLSCVNIAGRPPLFGRMHSPVYDRQQVVQEGAERTVQ